MTLRRRLWWTACALSLGALGLCSSLAYCALWPHSWSLLGLRLVRGVIALWWISLIVWATVRKEREDGREHLG